jgi:asparagine synthase (glutamine-hydrolysing)
MCGISGIISPDSSLVNASRIQKMTDTLAHRGPDGEGQWINEIGTVALGHRRLAIIDLSEVACQPMHYLSRYSIVHNGEIYNYIELQEALQKKGYSFFSKTDTEVIAAAYDCWGEDCLLQFDGMFAFAIWDEKEKTLFAARDRFGEKPFYFYRDDEQFLFASEMKALWAAGVERKINRKLLFNFLTIGYADNPDRPEETFFENISKLPAASILKFSLTHFHCSKFNYWDIETENENEKITDEEAIEQFRFLFQQSVKRRLRSDVPIGTSLSGGLDSSSVSASIHELKSGNGSYKCFSAVFPSFEKDEYSFSKKIAETFGLQHFTVQPDAASLAADFEKLFYHQEEPFGSASLYAQYKVYELASRQEVKVLLDGQGADETLAGYHKYYKWYWQELFKKRKLAGSRELQAAKKLGVTERFGWKNRVAALFPEFAAIVLEKQYLLHALRHEDLTREFIRLQSKEAYYETPEIFTLNGVLYFNTCLHGLEELLRYADRNSMTHGREIRLPFLNHELTEFVFSLPSHFKIRKGWTKWLLRKTMENSLPAEITWRRDKTGFEPPQEQWMLDEKIQQLVMEGKKKLVEEKILQPQVLNKKILPAAAYDAANSEWRYLTASMLFK